MREPLYSEILPRLFISGTDDLDTLRYGRLAEFETETNPFDSIVCLYADANPAGHHVREQRFPILDGRLEAETIPELLALAEWLHAEWKAGKTVAAKCQAGWNRSGLVMALVLLREGYSASEAISLIRAQRSPYALSNPHFAEFLHAQMRKCGPNSKTRVSSSGKNAVQGKKNRSE